MPKGNKASFIVSIFSGALLIVSGTTGSVGVYGMILSLIARFVDDALVLRILEVVALVLLFLASLGGLSVILGGYLIYKSSVRVGKLIIGIGAGMGIPGLLLTLFPLVITRDVSAVIAQHGVMGWSGIILSLIARTIAK